MSQLIASKRSTAFLAGAAVAAATFSAYLLFKGFSSLFGRRQEDEGERILKLIIYPIKSLAGVEVSSLRVSTTGMIYGSFHDRSYVLLNEHGNMITQRTKPKLSLIRTSFHGDDELWLDAPGLETLKIHANESQAGEMVHFQVWEQDTNGIDCGPTVNAWFSRFLGAPTRLIKFTSQEDQRQHRSSNVCRDGQVSHDPSVPIKYQDQTPVMLLNAYSIDDLNRRLPRDSQITYRNFRPNILVRAGGCAWIEDYWLEFSLGTIQFYNLKPCTRCTFTTVIPEEGIKHPKGEPLKTLKAFRIPKETEHLYKDSPLFGISLATHNEGVLSLDDEICLD